MATYYAAVRLKLYNFNPTLTITLTFDFFKIKNWHTGYSSYIKVILIDYWLI